jgi:hypothetical protein
MTAGVITAVSSACVATELEHGLTLRCLEPVQQFPRHRDEGSTRFTESRATQRGRGRLVPGGAERIELLHAPHGAQLGARASSMESALSNVSGV